jgi:peptide/nickel transport system substrate-binding protein
VLIQESLGKIGIKVTIEKVPGANWRTTLNKKELPMALNRFSGWLDYPEYYFFWNFHGNNSIFNISAYKSPAMDALIDKARFTADAAEYDRTVKEFIALCMAEVPVVPLNQPIHDVATQKSVSGYQFWFHREPDYRQFAKG